MARTRGGLGNRTCLPNRDRKGAVPACGHCLSTGQGCTTLKWNRWRDVGQAGSLRGGWLPPLSAAIAAVGRLTIGRSLPSCPTGSPPAWRTTYSQMQALLLMNRVDVHFCVAHPGGTSAFSPAD